MNLTASNKEMISHGYVAFLDILGFADLIRREESLKRFERFFNIIKDASTYEDGNIDYLMFSDSIVLSTNGAGDEQLIKILSAVAEISFEFLIKLQAPIRGCVSFGKFSRIEDAEGNAIIAGNPIIDAYHYEKKQNWIGVMISPELVRQRRDLRELAQKKYPLNMLIRHSGTKIPFHTEDPQGNAWFEGFAVIPHRPASLNDESKAKVCMSKDLEKYRNKLIELKICSPDIQAQQKYLRSINWIDFIRKSLRQL
jgi:hypothetical protein